MNPVLWMLIGAGAVSVLGLLFFIITEREFRAAFAQVISGTVAFPGLLLVGLITRWMPRAMRLSPEALKRFAAMETGQIRPRQSAWLLGYRGRGVIVVRRVRHQGWLNDVANTATRAKRDADQFAERPIARVRDDDPEVER